MRNKPLVFTAAAAVLSLTASPLPRVITPAAYAKVMLPQDKAESTQAFTGTITKNGDKYMLSDAANKVTYELDNPQKAVAFVGKKVKVVGTLDAEKKLIHVEAIDETA